MKKIRPWTDSRHPDGKSIPRTGKAFSLARHSLTALALAMSTALAAQTTDQIRQAVDTSLTPQVKEHARLRGAHRYQLYSRLPQSLDRLETCGQTPEVISLNQGKPPLGMTRQKVRCPEPSPWSVVVQTQVALYVYALVSQKTIGRNSAVSPEDVDRVEMDLAELPEDYLDSARGVLGKRLRYRIPAGKVITRDLLEEERLINKGDRVLIEFHGSGLQIRMSGEALEAGTLNQQIRVRNTESGKVIDSQVTGAGTVSPL